MSEIRTFLLPDLGEGLTESEVVSWRIAVGDTVTLNQIIAEVETAKAIVELPAPYAGIISRIYAEAGVTVNVGQPLLDVEVAAPDGVGDGGLKDGGSDAADGEPTMPISVSGTGEAVRNGAGPANDATNDATDDATATGDPQPENLVGYGAPSEPGGGPVRRARRRLETEAIPIVSADGVFRSNDAERARSTPPVRKLAHELGIDLEQLAGSGEGGAITRADVEAAFAGRFEGQSGPGAAGPAASGGAASAATPTGAPADRGAGSGPAAAGTPEQAETRIPIHGVRKHTAAAMVQSAFTAPHVSCFLTVDVSRSLELLEELKAGWGRGLPPGAARPGILALVAQAVCIALRRTPELNAHWDEDAQEIVLYRAVHLGIAAATARGLIVPVIADAQALGLDGLAEAIADAGAAARAGTTTPAALRGGTFSISNIGVFGIDAGTPILPPGQTGILALGAVRREPREWQGQIALRDVVTLSLSFDHRVVDGEQGAHFLRDVGAILNNPGRVLGML
ncbi:dihydrolipoamide acetyltransferase family protein [Microterricola viridarii]|uniref:Dihydrolipoamide acetyltransferase component of pyruvate dehydrogenase complex n=1 Tax=Microterricola viridarii TaxID=412690 RepID=A0A1H1X3V8_9MICO|nr:dihydrolipoamide acetyltransferase family protein [Microterricola viridarii]SDT04045.1 pyruvate dehydrogenase E2 component (dihydrolipoamide acetyltransferase) [Microterricola viridarii]